MRRSFHDIPNNALTIRHSEPAVKARTGSEQDAGFGRPARLSALLAGADTADEMLDRLTRLANSRADLADDLTLLILNRVKDT